MSSIKLWQMFDCRLLILAIDLICMPVSSESGLMIAWQAISVKCVLKEKVIALVVAEMKNVTLLIAVLFLININKGRVIAILIN